MSDAGWPILDAAGFHGPAGELVKVLEPHTEADPAQILVNFLVAFGNAAGGGSWLQVESTRHGFNLYAVAVGRTAMARKGTATDRALEPFRTADPEWLGGCVTGGLNSGEGLIWHVRDGTGDNQGVPDKRLLLVESEFASVLTVMERQGNTLSPVVRNAWDGKPLRTLTKNSPTKASGAHVSILGHITKAELIPRLNCTEAGNGFGNRFLWLCVRRSKLLPEGGDLDPSAVAPTAGRIASALEFAKTAGLVEKDPEARRLWAEAYPRLSEARPGLLGALTSRAEAQTIRLAGTYALLDRSRLIRPEHLGAALAVWNYCLQSARFIFGDALGDPIADAILEALWEAVETGEEEGLTRTQIRDLFGRHKTHQVGQALSLLAECGLAAREVIPTGGRPTHLWKPLRTTTGAPKTATV